jgi:hypothetical protein
MMNTLSTAYKAFVTAAIADPTLSRGDAGAIIEAFGPIMSGSQSRQWLDAVATLYESLGIINNPTYSSLRNEVVNEGQTVSEALFNSMSAGVAALAETVPVNAAITQQGWVDQLATIDSNVLVMENYKTGSEQLNTALDVGISALMDLKFQLEAQLGT